MSIVTPPERRVPVARLPEQLVASATFLMKRLGHAAKEQAMATYEEAGLHPYHHAILIVLGEDAPETQGSIADRLGYDRGQLVGLLDELEERGLLERRRDPHDRRRHLVKLTPDGKRTLARLSAVAKKTEDEFLEPLSDEEREAFHGFLLRLAQKHEPGCAHIPPPPPEREPAGTNPTGQGTTPSSSSDVRSSSASR